MSTLSKNFHHVQDNGNDEPSSKQEERNDRENRTGSTTLAPGQYLQGTGFKAWELKNLIESSESLASALESFESYEGPHPSLPNISVTSQDITRWKMAWRAIQAFERGYGSPFLLRYKQLIVQRCENWPSVKNISEELLTALTFSVAALIYGGLHSLAWYANFDSFDEQLVWRISACVVMGGTPVIWVLFNFTDNYLNLSLFGFFASGSVFLAYVLARGYLVVECFINLSHLPAEVYDVPIWSTYFPHIS